MPSILLLQNIYIYCFLSPPMPTHPRLFAWLTPSFHSGFLSISPWLHGPYVTTISHTPPFSLPLALLSFSPRHLQLIFFIACLFILELKLFEGNKKYLLRVFCVSGPFQGNGEIKVNTTDICQCPHGVSILLL